MGVFRHVPAILVGQIWGAFLLMGSLAQAEASDEQIASCFKSSYPQDICGYESGSLVWCDGTRMDLGSSPQSPFDRLLEHHQDYETRLDKADLRMQVRESYRYGYDGGRARYEPFFRKMYCDQTGSCQKQLVQVPWPDPQSRYVLTVHQKHGLAARLTRIAQRLLKNPESLTRTGQTEELRRYLSPPGGSFASRTIAGTSRPSAHSFGIAIDINLDFSDYWRWNLAFKNLKNHFNASTRPNRIPLKVVEAFEREGFIWGGRWHHYDTMHFEYRPEILCMDQTVPQSSHVMGQ